MLTSKQRSYLRGLANKIEPIFHVGKNSVTPELTKTIDEALAARELIKISVLENCSLEPAEVSELIGGRTRSEIVQVIGRKIVLYRQSKKPAIKLPS